MTPQLVTPATKKGMPKQQGLLRRGGRFYVNIKVPKDLRAAMGKEHIRAALKTSDYREACRRVVYENMRWKTVFDEERGKLAANEAPEQKRKRVLLSLTEREAHEIAARYLIRLEKEFREWWQGEGQEMGDEDRLRVIHDTATEVEVYAGGSEVHRPESGAETVHSCLNEEGLECSSTSPAFEVLRPLLRAVKAEHANRSLDLLEHRPVVARDTHFRDVFAHSPLPKPRQESTVGELLQRFAKAQKDGGRFQVVFQVQNGVLGRENEGDVSQLPASLPRRHASGPVVG